MFLYLIFFFFWLNILLDFNPEILHFFIVLGLFFLFICFLFISIWNSYRNHFMLNYITASAIFFRILFICYESLFCYNWVNNSKNFSKKNSYN